MAVKQNGVLAKFTPTISKYTNQVLPSAPFTVAPNGYNIYTCPGASLMSGKLFISNNTGGALNVDVGIVEQSDVIQLDTPGNQPGAPTTYSGFSLTNNPTTGFTTSVVIDYASLSGTFVVGEVISWTNSNRSPSAQTAILQYHDTSNGRLWLRNMSHPLGLDLPSGDTTISGAGGASCAVGTSHAGTGGTAGFSGKVRYFDTLTGQIYFQNYEFRNNIEYSTLYDTVNENREERNNSIARGAKLWRPVTTTQTRYAAAGQTTPATEFIDNNGVELLVSSVSQVTSEQLIVNNLSVADASVKEINGILLGTYQSLYVKSTGAVTFTLVGLEEVAEVPS